MHSNDYVRAAKTTESDKFYAEGVALPYFKETLINAIDALEELDKIKKALFYGKNLPLLGSHQPGEVVRNCYVMDETIGEGDAKRGRRLIHGIVGKATESGELLQALLDMIEGAPLDMVNLVEEIGDGFWYDAILLDEMKLGFEEVMHINIEKLKSRFPEKFSEQAAKVRDLKNERKVLELTQSYFESSEKQLDN